MKPLLSILAVVLTACGSADIPVCQPVARALPLAAAAPAPPRPYKFITLTWDSHDPADQVLGYRIYMGEQPGNYAGSLKLDLVHYLHSRCEVPVLINHPVTFFAVAAYNAAGEGPPSDELRYEYPELQAWLAAYGSPPPLL